VAGDQGIDGAFRADGAMYTAKHRGRDEFETSGSRESP
jgi:PleD family two-component response regulator